MDIGTVGGIVLAIACILGGQALEGGHAGSLVQATAAIIVVGGTIGAVLVSFPMSDFMRGLGLGKLAFKEKKSDIGELIKQVVDLAGIARREGVLALEQRMAEMKDPFLKRAVGFLVDGVDAAVARDALETEIDTSSRRTSRPPRSSRRPAATPHRRHHRRRARPHPRHGEPVRSVQARRRHRDRLRRDRLRRRDREPDLSAAGQQAETQAARRERAQDPDRRGRAVDPGRPQPARPRREAGGLRRRPRPAKSADAAGREK